MNSIKLCLWNANGLAQHKLELAKFLEVNNIDIIMISETRFTEKNYFKIKGYRMYDTKHPDGTAHGGTAILIKTVLKHYELQQYKTEHIQATSICLEEMLGNIVISAVYCPPKHNIKKMDFVEFFETLGDKFLAGGDYNSKHIRWGSRLSTTKGKQLNEAMIENQLDFSSSGHPTYWPTDRKKIPDLLDFCIIKRIPRTCIQAENSYDLSSDHSPVIFKLSTNAMKFQDSAYLTNKNTNWKLFKFLAESNCPLNLPLESAREIDDAINILTSILELAAKESTPLYRATSKVSYTSKDIQGLINEKRRIRRQWQISRSSVLKTKFNKAIKTLKNALNVERNERISNYLNELSPTEASDYSLWKATKKLKRPINMCPPIRKNDGNWARSDQEKCDVFAAYLKKVFQPNEYSICENNLQNIHSIDTSFFSPLKFKWKVVKKVIKEQIDAKKAAGHDLITGKMLKELPDKCIKLITHIFNAMTRSGYFPSKWKISQIIMILKPGKEETVASSYRPISLLSSLSKLFEKMLLQKLHPVLEDNKLIPEHQFGFRQQHSSIEQVHRVVNEIKLALDGKNYCSAVFLDVAQAFDKVWHEGLIFKIKQLLPGNFHKILENYILNRKFQVKYNECFTTLCDINAGVPQGSVLGPILYLLYTADLPTSSNVVTSTFADDTAIMVTNKNPQTASRDLQEHLSKVENWLERWRIKVNESKSTHITFTLNKRTCPMITLNNTNIPQHTNVKYLGLYLDRRLTWKKHIDMKRRQMKIKFSKMYWMMGRNSKLSLDCKLLLYKTIIMPIWTYGIQLWGTTSASNKDILQRAQSKILRNITNAPWYIRNLNIHADLGVPTVENITREFSLRYKTRLEHHPNKLAQNLVNQPRYKRLKKRDVIDLMNSI